jgi:hypothetical protein
VVFYEAAIIIGSLLTRRRRAEATA